MKKFLPALTALIVLCASAPAFATPPSQGSTVLVPPLISKGAVKSNRPMIVRLPTQAGKVSKMVATNLVAIGPSWIAKGDHYYSLCVPNRRMVACAPIVATSVMADIEVGAVADKDGTPLLTFKIAPATKVTPKRAAYAINYFLARTKKQVAHFNRMAVSYAPTPRQNALQVGPTSNYADAGGGGGCGYDDLGSYDCSGGSSGGGYEGGGGGGGYQGNENDYDPIPGPASTPNEPTGQCEGNCNYPSGNNNGDPDPCIDPNGNRICASSADIPSVPVVGQLPSDPACDTQPDGTVFCPMQLPMPMPMPFPGIPGAPIPNPNAPYFPQWTCNHVPVLCSRGQEPQDTGKTLEELLQNCEQQYDADIAYCDDHQSEMAPRMIEVCYSRADRTSLACRERAKDLTGNGAHAVP